ncbi:hypothetical protein BOTBODRAFT_587910 [Botryobasidium botryosum FD-172 SS1]|uniref:Uncharacterized protein n=1 Tax=Botryobasidium botryosum (strain FD-172 SS1) TaxID=930990 RepID=A0A067LXR4_BOTB1|nr:hypothetical protein BOTBODRAFT_587910 [Botryobasidium botryosum FD-172 SS1]
MLQAEAFFWRPVATLHLTRLDSLLRHSYALPLASTTIQTRAPSIPASSVLARRQIIARISTCERTSIIHSSLEESKLLKSTKGSIRRGTVGYTSEGICTKAALPAR